MFLKFGKKTTTYNSLFFLASLGAGGLVVTFFMYLMFMTNHKGFPIPTFDTLKTYFENCPLFNSNPTGNSSLLFEGLIVFATLGMAFFAFKHFQFLFWNLKRYFEFKKTKEFEKLKTSNAEVTLMTLPLTLAMSINVGFMIGAIFIPGLWDVVEYLFPVAIGGFFLVGVLALKIFGEYFTRLLTTGAFDFIENNNLSQMLSIFAFSMVGVGFAAPAAMSTNKITIAVALLGTIFFITIAIFFAVIKVVLGFKSILKHGVSKISSPTLWIMIPILTVIGISLVRQKHGLHTGFGVHTEDGSLFVLTTIIISLQLIFGFIGYKVMKANGYFTDYIYGKEKSPGSYALICPGVALFVSGFFFLHLGFVKNEIINKFSLTYFIFLLPLLYLQAKTIFVMRKLNKKMF